VAASEPEMSVIVQRGPNARRSDVADEVVALAVEGFEQATAISEIDGRVPVQRVRHRFETRNEGIVADQFGHGAPQYSLGNRMVLSVK
jgi:hypothetical protein